MRKVLPTVLVLACFVGCLEAQVTTATLYVAVEDPSGAVVGSASVSIREERTGVERRQNTNAVGECSFPFLPPGLYGVTVQSPGFKTLSITGITLDAAQSVRRNVVLELGAVVDNVTVVDQLAQVNTVSSEQLETVKSNQIQELPLATRRASDLFSLGTAIQRSLSTNNNNTAGSFKMNGLGAGAMNITMDGVEAWGHPATPQAGLRGGFDYIEVVSLEAIEEVHVAKGAFSAEFADAMSGNINVITKSGTNDWHGSLFENFNSEELNAREYFLSSKPAATFNQFGGSLGGPIVKNKAFIFGVYEGYRDRRFTAKEGDVFTESFRRQLLTSSPEFEPIIDEIALPNRPHDAEAITARNVTPSTFSANTNQFIVKPDVWLTDRSRIAATWLRGRPDNRQPIGYAPPGPLFFRNFIGEIDRLNITFTTFGSNWDAETRYGRNRIDNNRLDDIFSKIDSRGPEQTFGWGRQPGLFALFAGVIAGGEQNFVGNTPHWSIEQKVSLHQGKHSFKVGGIFSRKGFGGGVNEQPALFYFDPQSLLENKPGLGIWTFGTDAWTGQKYSTGFFLHDDWKIASNLTLNFGLRYDFYGAMVAKGLDGGSTPGIFNAPFVDFPKFVLGDFRPLNDPYNDDAFNFGPRFGFAYNPDGTGKTVIRGGIGVMFSPPNASLLELNVLNGLDRPFRVTLSGPEMEAMGIRYPFTQQELFPLLPKEEGLVSHDLIDDQFEAPYALNYTLGVQRALSETLMIETAFVGTAGRKFALPRTYNQVNPDTGQRPNPALGQAKYWDNSDSTSYVSWQTSIRKRMGAHLTGSFHYTWGKAMSYGGGDVTFGVGGTTQEFFDVAANRGRADEDITHRAVSSFVYSLPTLPNSLNRAVRTILGGWQASGIFTAQTGFPLTVIQSSSRAASRPDVIGSSVILDQGIQYLDPNAFAPVPIKAESGATIRPGSAGRNPVTGPGRWAFDLSLGKNVPITETVKLQVRADMLNAFNQVALVGVLTSYGSDTFGQRVNPTSPRRIQIHMRLSF